MKLKTQSLIILILLGISTPNSLWAAKEWQTMKSPHCVVYYHQQVPEDFAATVLESAEEEYRRVIENMGIAWYESSKWESPVSIYIYPDQESYINSGQAGWSHGSALVGSKTIRTFPSDQGFFDSVLPHELGHIILHEFLGNSADIPLWFDEGVAMYQEKAKRISANKLVREAMSKGQFISLTQLTDMRLYSDSDRATVELFYAESASIVNFMISEYGKNRFLKLCVKLKERQRFNDAITQVYMNTHSLDDLNRKWVNYLKD